ncbi:MAG: hypothetical protein Q9170_001955 [Blastenia crenularia]
MSVAALILSLLDTSSRTVRLIKGGQDAPIAIAELNNQLDNFRAMIIALKGQPLEHHLLQRELQRAEGTLMEISRLLNDHYHNDGSKRSKAISKIKWATKDQMKADKLLRDLSIRTSTLGILLNKDTMTLPGHRDDRGHNSESIIAVMGVTGSGKSRLIQQITQSREVEIGHTLTSATRGVQAYSITVDGRVITLVDTPGFDDTFMTDAQVLEELATWLSTTYKSKRLLSGIIYLHPITDVRMRGSATQSLQIFDRLVGPDSFHNILLVTTMWDLLPDKSVGESREESLRDQFWRPLIERGCITARSLGDRKSALEVMEKVAFDPRMAVTSGAPLTIQKEIVDGHKSLEHTSAGEALARRLDAMEESHRKQINSIESKNKRERNRMQEQIDKLQQEQARLKAGQLTTHDFEKKNVATDIYMRFTAEDFLNLDAPPPYSRSESSRARYFVHSIRKLADFSFQPARVVYESVTLAIKKMLRAKLLPGYTRIEWVCTCGDILYGDYVQRSPGSLQNLATQLKGRLIGNHTTSSGQYDASDMPPPPRAPPSAQLSSQASNQGLGHSASQDSVSNQHGSSPSQSRTSFDMSSTALIQPELASPKWLELCIRSSPDTYLHEEIDIRGKPTDQMFRKDKLAIPPSTMATASVMTRPSVPSPQEAQQYKYAFDPVPMDEPPIDTRTFNHYFHKPHLSDSTETWIKRFPQLQDVSLFHSNEKLAKGWGIEIIEDRNWILIVCVNLASLLLSGGVAGIYAYYMRDSQTAVAIGAWLSAVQMMVVTAFTWQWTGQ